MNHRFNSPGRINKLDYCADPAEAMLLTSAFWHKSDIATVPTLGHVANVHKA
jgi:hypothetical protein